MRKNLCKLLMCSLFVFATPLSVYATTVDEVSGIENTTAEQNDWDTVESINNIEHDQDIFNNINYNALFGIATLDVNDNTYYEAETNDYLEWSNLIYHDYTVVGDLSGDDIDCYQFTVSKTSDVTFVAASVDPYFFIGIYDDDGEPLASSVDLGQEEGYYYHIYSDVLSAGTYYAAAMNDNYADDIYSFYLEILPHTHSYEADVTAPTCKDMGYTTYTCYCGHDYIADYTAATEEHSFYSYFPYDYCEICKYIPITDELYEAGIHSGPMYRMYNPNSGEHFYTGSTVERDNLIDAGWNYEGVAWNAPAGMGEPVYRLYNPNAGDHHYTMSREEAVWLVNLGWNYEGIGWYSATINDVLLYRLYNPNAISGSHHYTGSEEERDYLVSLGWIYEGGAWYGMLK